MRLAYPQASATLTRVNGRAVVVNRIDTLHALQTVELTGEIQQLNQRVADFSGTLQVTLYDKATTQYTLGSEVNSPKMAYQAFTSPIFTGQVPVSQGRFVVRFTMPKDINYTVGRSKLFMYAIRTDSLVEASGSYDSLRVGGSVIVDSVDTQPPGVAISVVGSTREGDVVRVAGPDITIRIALTDNRGINIARSGLGHELTAQFTNQTPVVLNDYYIATGVDGRQGQVLYTFRDVTPGTYTIRSKAWDINNNSGEGALTIVVSERPGLALLTLRASPNPVITQTRLTAQLNRAGEPLDWTWSIYDLNGRLWNQQSGQCTDCDAELDVGNWSGFSDNSQSLPNGLYLMNIQVRSATDGTLANGTARLVLLK